MFDVITVLLRSLMAAFKNREKLLFENLALRHELNVLKRKSKRPHLRTADRLLWLGLKRVWPDWKRALRIVRPETMSS